MGAAAWAAALSNDASYNFTAFSLTFPPAMGAPTSIPSETVQIFGQVYSGKQNYTLAEPTKRLCPALR